MSQRIGFTGLLTLAGLLAYFALRTNACCPAPPSGKPVVNADQTVILIWDAANKTQHFIRKASFKSDADDFGFIVPTPTQPVLAESGNEAFPYLLKLTEPEVRKRKGGGGMGLGCSARVGMEAQEAPRVTVLETKEVAGFNATVLEATDASELVRWLKENGYDFSPRIAEWARPYVARGWKFTALKVAKDKRGAESKQVAAAALRISFKTDRPLFPYREPDPSEHAGLLGAQNRLLRIYFLSDGRYEGKFQNGEPWTGIVAWAGRPKGASRQKILQLLDLPETTGAQEWFLTEFEDNWPYRAAPSDVYFSRSLKQDTVHRRPIIQYVSSREAADPTFFALAAVVVSPVLLRRFLRRTGF